MSQSRLGRDAKQCGVRETHAGTTFCQGERAVEQTSAFPAKTGARLHPKAARDETPNQVAYVKQTPHEPYHDPSAR
jgi:hypothetical protein